MWIPIVYGGMAFIFYVVFSFIQRKGYNPKSNPTSDAGVALFVGLFWPIALLLVIGIAIISYKNPRGE